MAKKKKDDADEFMTEMRERFRRASEYDSDIRRQALDDVRFVFEAGQQWDDETRRRRKKRPCYEFNRLRQAVKQVLGDQRRNRPQVKVRGVDSSADPATAETLNGLIRNIEQTSNAERAYDTAFELAVAGGFGAWRITTDYEDDSAFEQEIRIREIRNPFTVNFDPSATEWDRRDGMYAFVSQLISKDEYKTRWPDKDMIPFEASAAQNWAHEWLLDDQIRIAEYWVKTPVKKQRCLLSDGRTVDKEEIERVLDELAAQGVTVVREREVSTHKVEQYIVSGAEVLEGPTAWAGRFIPIVPVWGELMNIDGREVYFGMGRFGKDPQRAYNFHRTVMIESAANAPKVPYLLTPEMIKGHDGQWAASQAEQFPYLLYNPDARAPGGRPIREPGAEVPAALINLSQIDADDIKATTGIYDASLGARSNETSGRAILARQQEGDNATFNFIDNLARSIKYTGEILIDLIPRVYDTQRIVRIIGEDGAEKAVKLYEEVQDQQTGQLVRVNDLSRGRYDVTVTVGPSYATQRMEAADQLLQLSSSNPQIAPIITDLIVKNLDMPGANEASKRIRRLLVSQGIVEPEGDEQGPPRGPSVAQQAQDSIANEAVKQAQAKTIFEAAQAQKVVAETDEVHARTEKTRVDTSKGKLEAEKIALEIRAMEQSEASGVGLTKLIADAARQLQ